MDMYWSFYFPILSFEALEINTILDPRAQKHLVQILELGKFGALTIAADKCCCPNENNRTWVNPSLTS